MKTANMRHISSHKKAYTLLFAALTAAVVLGVAVFISSVSRKQFILASTARDSLFAIYNADSGIECAITNWVSILPPDGDSFNCNGQIIDVEFNSSPMANPPAGWGQAIESIPAKISFGPQRGCALVSFIVSQDQTKTAIISRGYNLGDATNCPMIGPRTVERAMQLTYE